MMRYIAVISILIFFGCGKTEKKGSETESKLYFPEDAEKVIIFGQSSHLDISWFYTPDEYYEKLVKNIFIETIDFIKSDPIHKAFFAEMFWIDRFLREEDYKTEFLKLLKEGRIKIEGGGVGTDDQLVVPTEGIIRNYISGHNKIKELGMSPPTNAWIPDSFGFSRTTPDLYKIMGFEAIALSRVNGFHKATPTYYVEPLLNGSYKIPQESVAPNSAAWELMQKGQLLIWQGEYGNEIILYWMPFLYGIGSSFFCESGIPPTVYINPDLECLGDKATEEKFSQKLITYLSEIKPNSKFVFIPIGWDFEKPKKDLGKYIRYWNKNYFPRNKIYVTAGSFSDFISLVKEEKDKLPRLSGHLAPYWTGYYGSHSELKRFIFEIIFKLLSIETSASILSEIGIDKSEIKDKLSDIWWMVSMLTNHDTGAGTLYKRVYNEETKKLIQNILGKIQELENIVYEEFSQRTENGKYVVINPLGFSRKGVPSFGFKITESIQQYEKSCSELGFEIKPVLWEDDGGSWRIGSETPPGKFTETPNPPEVKSTCKMENAKIIMKWETDSIPLGYSLTLRISFPNTITKIKVEGHLELSEYDQRYLVYNPTFLPYLTFFKVYLDGGKSYTFSTKGAKGVSKTSEKSVDIFLGRNVRFEKYDILGPPGDMDEDGPFSIEIQITQDKTDFDSFLSSYSFHFPLIVIAGKGEKTTIPSEFSVLSVKNNIGILFSKFSKQVRVVIPSEKLDFESSMFSLAKPISPITQKEIKISNTFAVE